MNKRPGLGILGKVDGAGLLGRRLGGRAIEEG